MIMHIVSQGKDDPPTLAYLKRPILDLTHNEEITFCVVEKGMGSGDPSVIIVTSDTEGSICLQTSLDKFLSGAAAMSAIAETQWGWKRQEGHYSMMPMEPETRKILLEAIKKELEEWE